MKVTEVLPTEGFLRSWIEYCEPFEFSDEFALYSLLAVVSAAIDHRIRVNPGTEPSPYPNLYVILYGPSGSRKGTAMKRALKLMASGMQDEENAPTVLPRSFTFERLMTKLSEQSEERGRCEGIIISDEFQRLVGGREYQGDNLGFLTELWDCNPAYTRDTHAHGTEELLDPYITTCACLTPDGVKKIDPAVLDSGGLRRILMVPSYRAKRVNARPEANDALFEALVQLFHERLGSQSFAEGTMMVLSEQTQAAMTDWYEGPVRRMLDSCNEREGYFISCAQAHVLKIGAVIQVLETGDPTTLELFAFDTARKLVDLLMPQMFEIYSGLVPTEFARNRAAALRTTRGVGGEIATGVLVKALVQSLGVKHKEIMEVVLSLIHDGLLIQEGGKVRLK